MQHRLGEKPHQLDARDGSRGRRQGALLSRSPFRRLPRRVLGEEYLTRESAKFFDLEAVLGPFRGILRGRTNSIRPVCYGPEYVVLFQRPLMHPEYKINPQVKSRRDVV